MTVKKNLGNLFACVQLRVSAEISIYMRMHDATWPFYQNRYQKTLPPVPVSFRLLPVNLPLVTVKVGKIASCIGYPLFFFTETGIRWEAFATTLEYVMEGNFVERYRKKMS